LEPVFHDAKATELLYARTAIVNNNWKLNVPILIPVFPRTYDDYIQSLNLWLPADCNCPELERPDLQLIAMIEDAQERLRSMGYIVDRKVFMNGFSASCGFTVGFAMLHPDAVKAAACGGGLPYDYDPQRISTLEVATSTQIDLAAYFAVPLYLYLGEQDGNYDADLWLSTRQFYESAGANAKLVLYAGTGHTITDRIWSDLRNFFEYHKAVSDTVQKIYIGYYQRPADPAGLIWWADSLGRSDGNLNTIIEAYANSEESRSLYGQIDGSNITAVINDIYRALFNRDADTAGRDWYVAEFNKGAFTAATIMLNVLNGARNEDLTTLNNKLTAANLFTRTIDPELDGTGFQATYEGNEDAAAARYYLGTVTANAATVPTQNQAAEYIRTYIADPNDGIHTP